MTCTEHESVAYMGKIIFAKSYAVFSLFSPDTLPLYGSSSGEDCAPCMDTPLPLNGIALRLRYGILLHKQKFGPQEKLKYG